MGKTQLISSANPKIVKAEAKRLGLTTGLVITTNQPIWVSGEVVGRFSGRALAVFNGEYAAVAIFDGSLMALTTGSWKKLD